MPQLVDVFLCYQASTCHGSLDPIVHPPVNCGCTQWHLCITCVYPSSMYQVACALHVSPINVFLAPELEMLQSSIWKCFPAPVQLLSHGLFGCSPYRPRVVIDIKQLNFLSILHSNTAPNLSAWYMSLQEHLGSLGHLFDTKVSLNTCLWYYIL
ncbi:hypothetical protein BS47DRAFT_1301346 [Hydnum rufescens UP504]|uniref:Uncharacterized protein n=1 Tax=Hydnum rufescens UP504 TaxID=1448309 RepID=A0A9P6ARJ3_9AGAM|nr:hypothetical protein BS47DRAFT_1301346 [Hydnum rufescens UP504]